MMFSGMRPRWGKVNEGAVEFHNGQWFQAFMMGKMLSALKVRFSENCVMCSFCKWWGI